MWCVGGYGTLLGGVYGLHQKRGSGFSAEQMQTLLEALQDIKATDAGWRKRVEAAKRSDAEAEELRMLSPWYRMMKRLGMA